MNSTVPSALLLGLLLAAPVPAQDSPIHASERDNWDQNGVNFSDTWGELGLGFIGSFGDDDVFIVDVSNPDNISLEATYVAEPSSAQDLKSAGDLLFVMQGGSSSNGVDIVDIRNPASPQHLTYIDAEPGSYESLHNLSYEDGWLYLCNSSDATVAIVDLRNYDIDNPPANIGSWTYQLTNIGAFVHDITVLNGRLYCSGWDCMDVYDVSDNGNSAPTFLGRVRGVSSHAVWPTADGEWVVTTEERQGGAVRLYEVDDSSGYELIPRDSYVPPGSGDGATYSAHNVVIKGDRAYVSNYQAGVYAFQIDRTHKTFEVVARYDTSTFSPGGFDGCWGVYPFLGDEQVLASDQQNGLYTLDFSGLDFTFPSPRPKLIAPVTPASIDIEIVELGLASVDPGSVKLHTSIDDGGFSETVMSNSGGNTWTAEFPALLCGNKVEYYFSADSGGETFTSPQGAPSPHYTAWAGDSLSTVFSDDFETDKGWTVNNINLTDGAWERANPHEDGAQPEDDDPDGTGTFCYITGDGTAGGSTGSDDVDGGPTQLLSPTFDLSGGDALISYKRWFFNSNQDTSDNLLIEISNDGGSSWTTVENLTLLAGGWKEHCFRASDEISLTSNMRMRFSVDDNPNDSLTEGGLDTFVVATIECEEMPTASATQRNGTGVNVLCYSSNPPVLGTTWTAQVDHGHHPGATFTSIVARTGAATGPIINGGELLLSLGSTKLFVDTVSSSGTFDIHSKPIPLDPKFAGLSFSTQAAIFGGSGLELCNAVDFVVGF